MTSTMSSSFESMDLLSSTSSMRLSHAAEELLSRCQHPENIVKRVIVAEFTTGVCLMDWKRPGVKDRGLDDHGVAALIKFFFQFGADIKGGQIRKVILEENDFEAEYFNSRKQQGSVGGTSAAASRNMFRRSVTASAESNKLHVRSRSAKDINSNKLLEQEEQQQQQQDFGGLSDRIYVQCATGNGRIIYAAVFIDGRDEWMPLAQDFVQKVATHFTDRYGNEVLALRTDLKKIADGIDGADEKMHQDVMNRFHPYRDFVQNLTRTVFCSRQ